MSDPRTLIVNCDDFGMHEGVNTGVLDAIERGIARSCSLMAVCPGTGQAIGLLRDRPDIPFGIHLTLVRDSPRDRWAPRSDERLVPSLLDEDGAFFTAARRAELLARARLPEVEVEFRAQIDSVVDAGLTPTHLGFHCLADGGRADILDLTTALAAEYGLATRIWLAPGRRAARRRGLPVIDNDFLDSFALDLDGKAERYAHLLRTLPPGLSEWAVHPSTSDEHSPTRDEGWRVRRTDHAFLTSPQAREIVAEEGITLIDYTTMRRTWATVTAAGG